jgi:hypothetical protein
VRSLLASLITVMTLLSACVDPVDRAAKERIFSPEDPPKVVSAAKEQLRPEDVADDPRVARRVLGMSAAEVTERIGSHVYTAKTSFEWNTGSKDTVRLEETRKLVAGEGGVAGNFHGLIENSREQGIDVLRVDGKVYAKSRFGKYRLRLRDRGMAERVRSEVQGAVRDFDSLFDGRLLLKAEGTETREGRLTWKYGVSLAEKPPKLEKVSLPPAVEPKGGRDSATLNRLAFFDLREPKVLTGNVWVDQETSVVLAAKLNGRIAVPAQGSLPAAEVRITLDSAVTNLGKAPELKAPEAFLPDEDKPQGIADALDQFGVPRAGAADAGTAGPTDPVVPDDE